MSSKADETARTQRADTSNPDRSRVALFLLLAILFGAFAIRMGMWWAAPSFHHPDEVFQYREQAYRLVTGQGVIPWEYQEGIRSWLLPGAMSAPMFVSHWLTGDTLYADWLIAAALALLSLVPVYAGWVYGRVQAGLAGAVVAGLWMLAWYDLVYFSTHMLTSPISGHLLIAGGLLWGLALRKVGKGRLFAGAAVLALAAVLRPHMLPIVLLMTLFATRQQGLAAIKWIAAGAGTVVLTAGLIDLLTFDYPYQWAILYYKRNIVDGVASTFGTTPWWDYGKMLARSWLYLAPALSVLFILGARKLPGWSMIGIAVVVLFSLIGHKEFRFIYPGLAIAMLVCAIGLATLVPAILDRLPKVPAIRWAGGTVLTVVLITAGVQRSTDYPYHEYWRSMVGSQMAMRELHGEASVQCVFITHYDWWDIPHYSMLRRDAVISYNPRLRIEDAQGRYTHVISGVALDSEALGLEPIGQWCDVNAIDGYVFAYRSTQQYAGIPITSINQYLADQERKP